MLRFLLVVLVGGAVVLYAMTPRQQPAGPPATAPDQGALTVPVTFTLTEAQVQAVAGRYFPQSWSGATISDPVIRLVPGRITLDARASLGFLVTDATLAAVPQVRAGKAALVVESASIGGVPLPDAVREAVAAQLARAIGDALPPQLTLTGVEVQRGVMTVSGRLEP